MLLRPIETGEARVECYSTCPRPKCLALQPPESSAASLLGVAKVLRLPLSGTHKALVCSRLLPTDYGEGTASRVLHSPVRLT